MLFDGTNRKSHSFLLNGWKGNTKKLPNDKTPVAIMRECHCYYVIRLTMKTTMPVWKLWWQKVVDKIPSMLLAWSHLARCSFSCTSLKYFIQVAFFLHSLQTFAFMNWINYNALIHYIPYCMFNVSSVSNYINYKIYLFLYHEFNNKCKIYVWFINLLFTRMSHQWSRLFGYIDKTISYMAPLIFDLDTLIRFRLT